jgi:hypothetical protein
MSSTIGVQNIAHTNGTVAATVASDGDITASADLTVSGAFTSQGIDDNADATAITIDSSENVGIGTTSPAFATGTGLQVKGSNFTSVRVTSASSTGLDLSQTNDGTSYLYNRDNGALIFGINDTERMRLSTLNRFLVGTTTDRGKLTVLYNSNSNATPTLWCGNDGSSAVWISFGNSSGGVYGSISRSGSATAYNTTSDHRLKENVDYTFDATTRLKQLKPCRFNFIADADTTVDGFLAHEVQSVVPEAITGTHNEEDDEGNPVMQGIDQSKLVPLLVKTIQELEARITALENG